MTNQSKWIIAIPFALIVSILIPSLITSKLLWFLEYWADTLYVMFSGGMWLVATAFVDLNRPRGSPDLANRLIPIGLILSVPISVWDRSNWFASDLPSFVDLIGVFISIVAIVLGLLAKQSLGPSYSPRASHDIGSLLVLRGPYRWIRHPLYLAAILWVVGWPLIISSILGIFVGLCFVLPAIYKRMIAEEEELHRVYGEEYAEYQGKTWRLVPFVY
jgi:protein-S-isoprenylcysteine O-methyltransferase Ste14